MSQGTFSKVKATDDRMYGTRGLVACGYPPEEHAPLFVFTQKELHTLMGAYRRAGLAKQLWATLTPTSEDWSLSDLLEELAREAEAVKKQGPRS